MNHGLIPGGVSLKTGRHAVFFTVVNPMDNQDGLEETFCDLSKARIAPYKNTWKHFQDTVFWCNLKLAQQRGLQFHQTRSNAVILRDTLPAEFIERAICVKTKDHLYQRESVTLRPRVVPQADSQSGSQYLPVQEARSSWESQQDAESYGKTRSNTADYRVPGTPISTVKLQDARRQNNITKLIEMFEQEINKFSEESQQLFVDMNSTEIVELCENSAKLQCPDCNSFKDIEITYCSCERNLKYKRSPTTNKKGNNDYTSIPDFVIEKNSTRRPKHGQSERQIMFFKAKEMLKKARQQKHGNHPTILGRWYEEERYRDSLAEHNVGEKEIMLYDRIALERHDYAAARAERLQNAKHWVLRFNADGPQEPLRQRQEFADAFEQCQKVQDAHMAETEQTQIPIHPQHQQRQRQNRQFEGGEHFDYYVDRKTGWRYYREPRGNLPAAPPSSFSTSQWPTSKANELGRDFGFLERIPENRRKE